MSNYPGRISAFLILSITFSVYIPSLNNEFLFWDDNQYITNNFHIQVLNQEFFKWLPSSIVASNWHPLTMLSHAVDYAIWGDDPFGHRLTNNTLHSLNTLLFFFLSLQLLNCIDITGNIKKNSADSFRYRKKMIVGGLAALLFGVHPIHVESVAWLSERKDVLFAFFYLAAMIFYLRYALSSNKGKKTRLFLLCFTSATLSCLSKPMAVSIPLVLLILDYYPLKRVTSSPSLWPLIVEKIPFLALSCLISVIAFLSQKDQPMVSTEHLPVLLRILNAIHSYIFYLIKMALPLNLAPYYPYATKIDLRSVQCILPLLLFILITSLAFLLKRKKPFLLAIWTFYLLTLLPVIGLVQVGQQAAADRYLYIPGLAFFLMAGYGLYSVLQKWSQTYVKLGLFSLYAVTIVLLICLTGKQITVWKDDISLWTHEIDIYPGALPRAYDYRGQAYLAKFQEFDKALMDLNTAIDLAVKIDLEFDENRNAREFGIIRRGSASLDYHQTFTSRAMANIGIGDYFSAIKDADFAIDYRPGFSDGYFARGLSNFYLGNYSIAKKDMDKSITLNPRNAKAHKILDSIYRKLLRKDRGKHIKSDRMVN